MATKWNTLCETLVLSTYRLESKKLRLVIGGQVSLALMHAHRALDPRRHPRTRAACLAATVVWAEGMAAFAETLSRYYPDDNDRSKFAIRVKEDILNLEYHMCAYLYRDVYALLIGRYVVIGRRPEIDTRMDI